MCVHLCSCSQVIPCITDREIQEVYSGTLPAVRIQSNCRCPPATPRVKPQDTRYCLSNGVPDNAGDATLRVSQFSHPVEYANDEDVNTVWISMFQNDVTLEVVLGDQFEVSILGKFAGQRLLMNGLH